MNTLITRESRKSVEEVCTRLLEVSPRHQFGVLGMHDLREKMVSKGVPFQRACRVVEVCNPQQAGAILQTAIEVSAALPCRISVYETDRGTVLATLRPSALLGLFAGGDPAIAEAVESTLVQIMDDAAG